MVERAIGFAITDPAGGVAYYRGAAPANALRARGHTVVVSDALQQTPTGELVLGLEVEEGPPVAWSPDVIVLTGGWPSAIPVEWLHEARAAGQVVVVDLDDWPWIPSDNYHHEPALALAKAAAVGACDQVTCSTPYLAARVLRSWKPVAPVRVCRNIVEPRMFSAACAVNFARLESALERDTITVGFRGGLAWHRADVQHVAGVLRELAELEPRVRFVHVGHIDRVKRTGAEELELPTFAEVCGLEAERVATRPLVPYRDYPHALGGVDLGIVPLTARPFSLAKSCIGGLEWTAAGVPWIASATPEYFWLDPTGCAQRSRQWLGLLRALLAPDRRAEWLARQAEVVAGSHLFAGDELAGADWSMMLEELPTRATPSEEGAAAIAPHHEPESQHGSDAHTVPDQGAT